MCRNGGGGSEQSMRWHIRVDRGRARRDGRNLHTTCFARSPPRRSRARAAPLNNPHPHLRVSIPTLESSPAITARPLRRTPRRISFNAVQPAEVHDSLLEGAVLLGAGGLESAFELR